MSKLCEVYIAEPDYYGSLSSLGRGSGVLIRQHKFPWKYDGEQDILVSGDHDRLMQRDLERTTACFRKHTSTGDLGLVNWCRTASVDAVKSLLQDLLQTHENYPDMNWTGWRILGTVNRSNGYPVWSLQLFSNKSHCAVYSKEFAPNVLPGPRYDVDGKRLCYTRGDDGEFKTNRRPFYA